MTVAIRIIPCLDVDPRPRVHRGGAVGGAGCPAAPGLPPGGGGAGGGGARGVTPRPRGAAGARAGRPRRYDAEGADELTFLDITASSGERATMYDVVRRTAEQ